MDPNAGQNSPTEMASAIPVDPAAPITITASDCVLDFAKGQVPTLKDSDMPRFARDAIVRHRAERFPTLMPLEWAIAARNTLEPPFMDHAVATLFQADEP